MRTRKIRGYNRILQDIREWSEYNKELNAKVLKQQHREYVKVWVHPFSSISMLNSQFPAPKGKARKLILKGLLDIYDHWKAQLDELGEAYYLKIWLYPEDISRSQVVCAIGEFLTFYEHTFHIPDADSSFPFDQFGDYEERLSELSWKMGYDEIHLEEEEPSDPDEYATEADFFAERRWYRRQLKKPYRATKNTDGSVTYSVKKAIVWLGG